MKKFNLYVLPVLLFSFTAYGTVMGFKDIVDLGLPGPTPFHVLIMLVGAVSFFMARHAVNDTYGGG